MDAEELQARIDGQYEKTRQFKETTFLGSLTKYHGNTVTGNLDLVISVGPGEMDFALPLKDAPGEQLLIHVERISGRRNRRGGSAKGRNLAGKPGLEP